jgi:DNA primase
MSGIDYSALRAAISMQQVLVLLGFQPVSRRGQQLRGPCPIHDPAATVNQRCFSVRLDRHIFRCFACGAHGNQLDLWQLVHRLPLHESTLHLCRHAQISPPVLHIPVANGYPRIRNSHQSSPRPATH